MSPTGTNFLTNNDGLGLNSQHEVLFGLDQQHDLPSLNNIIQWVA
jgi:hypothetical protein